MRHFLETYKEMPDDLLIEQILAGNKALFEIIIRRYDRYLYKIGRSYRYSHEDTEDLMQEAFVNAYLHLQKFEHRASFKTWVSRIMLNGCYQLNQKKHRQAGWELQEHPEDHPIPLFAAGNKMDTNYTVMNRELNHILESALIRIPLSYLEVFVLREANGHSVAETAELLRISEPNVKVRLLRAKAMLRSEIAKAYQPEDLFEFNLIYCDALVHRIMITIQTG